MTTAATTIGRLDVLERYHDAAPRPSCDTEELGREPGVPRALERVHQTTPSLLSAARAAGDGSVAERDAAARVYGSAGFRRVGTACIAEAD